MTSSISCPDHYAVSRDDENSASEFSNHSTGSRSQTGDTVEHSGSDRGVSVRVGPLPNRLGFFVDDDGPGIPESDRDTVLESGYTTSDSGSGFGLAIVEQIATAHDWDVEITESEAGGARFEFDGSIKQPN